MGGGRSEGVGEGGVRGGGRRSEGVGGRRSEGVGEGGVRGWRREECP